MLVFFGMSPQEAVDITPSSFCRLISEFALEYRTARERALTQQQKRQKRGERNKTRGKMITEVSFSLTAPTFARMLSEGYEYNSRTKVW